MYPWKSVLSRPYPRRSVHRAASDVEFSSLGELDRVGEAKNMSFFEHCVGSGICP